MLRHNISAMTIATVAMLVLTLCLVPLRISVRFLLDENKRLFLKVKLFFLSVMEEKLVLSGRYLHCCGTVDERVDLASGGANLDIFGAITLQKISVVFATNYATSPIVGVAQMSAIFVARLLCVANTNCKVAIFTTFALKNTVRGQVIISVTLAEIFVALAKSKIKRRLKNSVGR